MTTYARVRLSDHALESAPDAPPPELLGWTDDALADVAAALDPCPEEWRGLGWWPVIEVTPAYDLDTHRLSDDVDYVVNAETRVVTATRGVVPLTLAEVAAREIAAAKAELTASDAAYQPRWYEDLVAGHPPHTSALAWIAKRDALRARLTALTTSTP